MIDGVEIPTVNLGFSAVASSKKVLRNDCDDNRPPEIAIWLLKPHIHIALVTYYYLWLSVVDAIIWQIELAMV